MCAFYWQSRAGVDRIIRCCPSSSSLLTPQFTTPQSPPPVTSAGYLRHRRRCLCIIPIAAGYDFIGLCTYHFLLFFILNLSNVCLYLFVLCFKSTLHSHPCFLFLFTPAYYSLHVGLLVACGIGSDYLLPPPIIIITIVSAVHFATHSRHRGYCSV